MNQEERTRILNEYEIMGTEHEREFDDIAELASALYGTPMSAISFIDNNRQWIKAEVGMSIGSTPVEHSFCYIAAQTPDEVIIVPDSLQKPDLANNPYVTGDPNVRFYAGAPLVTTEGYAIGTICVIDNKPRSFTQEETRMLKVLASRVMRLLELRKENLQQRKQIDTTSARLELTLARFMEAQKNAHIGNWDFNVRTQELYWSPEMFALLLKQEATGEKGNLADWEKLVHPQDIETVRMAMVKALKTRKPTSAEFRIVSGGTETWLLGHANIVYDEKGRIQRICGTLQDITERKQAEKDRAMYTQMLEDMLFDVSHKIRKPLTTIMGLLPVLKHRDISSGRTSDVFDYFIASANELEGYTRELNKLLHQGKIDLNVNEKQEVSVAA